MKSDKTPCIIYTDLESLIKKIDNCKNNPEKSSATKIGNHIPCGYSMSTIWAIKHRILYKQSWRRWYEKVLHFCNRTCSRCN